MTSARCSDVSPYSPGASPSRQSPRSAWTATRHARWSSSSSSLHPRSSSPRISKGATRYRLLDTIREYAAERLEEGGAADEVRRRHVEHFLDVARQAGPDYVRFAPEEQRAGLAILDAERENMHAAVQWAVANEPDLALPLAVELRHYWLIRGYQRQGLNWLDEALAMRTARTLFHSRPGSCGSGVAGPDRRRVRACALVRGGGSRGRPRERFRAGRRHVPQRADDPRRPRW